VQVLDQPVWFARHFSIGPLAVIGREAAAIEALRPPALDTSARIQAPCWKRGFCPMLESTRNEVLASAGANGVSETGIDEVLMVSGSTLLPGV